MVFNYSLSQILPECTAIKPTPHLICNYRQFYISVTKQLFWLQMLNVIHIIISVSFRVQAVPVYKLQAVSREIIKKVTFQMPIMHSKVGPQTTSPSNLLNLNPSHSEATVPRQVVPSPQLLSGKLLKSFG